MDVTPPYSLAVAVAVAVAPSSSAQGGETQMSRITPCLWFDGRAEEAASFYVSLLPDSHVDQVVRSPADTPSGQEGSVLLVEFTLAGQRFTALNGGPQFTFNESVSFVIDCADQEEIDRLWEALTTDESAEQCGWLKDRYGLSWQIVPSVLTRLLTDPDAAKARRVMTAMLGMKKLEIAELELAAVGEA
jgi:predicted 3-demethylubiquinone-9 3-methyltransferase (glyoxalase superfamily)